MNTTGLRLSAVLSCTFLLSWTAVAQQPQAAPQFWGAETTDNYSKESGEKAKTAFERGLIAAQQKEWDLALKYFRDARNSIESPGTLKMPPELLFNLGVSHAGAGHELIAMAYLHAFLAGSPNAPNAEAIRKELLRLEISTEARIAGVIKRAQGLASGIKNEWDRNSALQEVAKVQARAGDIEAALKLVPASAVSDLWSEYGAVRLALGNVDEAMRAAARSADPTYGNYRQSLLYTQIAQHREEQGDIAGANSTRSLVTSPIARASMLFDVAKAKIEKGDFSDFDETIKNYSNQDYKMVDIAVLQLKRNNFAAARQIANRVGEAEGEYRGFPSARKAQVLEKIAIRQLERNDRSAAEATAREALALGPAQENAVGDGKAPFIYTETATSMYAILGNYDRAIAYTTEKESNGFMNLFSRTMPNVLYIMNLRGDVARGEALAKQWASWDNRPYLFETQFVRGQFAAAMATAESYRTDCRCESALPYVRDAHIALQDPVPAEKIAREGGMLNTPARLRQLIEAFESKKLVSELKTALADWSKLIAENYRFQGGYAGLKEKFDLLTVIVDAQTRLGDPAGAELSKSRRPDLAAYRGYDDWKQLAYRFENEIWASDVDAALQKAAAASTERSIVGEVAKIADDISKGLNEVLGFDKRFGRR